MRPAEGAASSATARTQCASFMCATLWKQHALRWHGPRGGIERVRCKVSSRWGKVGNNE